MSDLNIIPAGQQGAIIPFTSGAAPSYAQADAAYAEAMSKFNTGESLNRISLKAGRFRLTVGGEEILSTPGPLNVVVHGFAPSESRRFYAAAFDANEKGYKAPDCYSKDNVTPESNSVNRQSQQCSVCPQNVKVEGRGKACSTIHRLAVSIPGDKSFRLFVLDVSGMSIYGTSNPAANLYNLKEYRTMLSSRDMRGDAVVVALVVDETASVSKMMFAPVGYVDEATFNYNTANLDAKELTRYTDFSFSSGSRAPTLDSATAGSGVLSSSGPAARTESPAQQTAQQGNPFAAQQTAQQGSPFAAQQTAQQGNPFAAQQTAQQEQSVTPASNMYNQTPASQQTVEHAATPSEQRNSGPTAMSSVEDVLNSLSGAGG